MYQVEQYPDFPWCIRRNQRKCARAATRKDADRIVAQLKKIHRTATFTVEYQGKALSHCGDGGQPLD